MKRLFMTGLVFNLAIGCIFFFFSTPWALGYLIGSFAMSVNMLGLARGGWVAGASFFTLIALTYGLVQVFPSALFPYALGLASPAFYGLIQFGKASP